MRVLCEALLVRGDQPLLYDKLAISNTYSHANNRNDLRPITLSRVSLPEVGVQVPPSPSREAGDSSELIIKTNNDFTPMTPQGMDLKK